MPPKMTMCHTNIQSLGTGELGPTTRANSKLDQMRTIFKLEHKFDIIGVSETWLTQSVTDEDINLESYDVYRKDRNGRGGGVCIYVNSALPSKRREDLETPTLELYG